MPSNNLQFTLRSGLTMGSLFTGASMVHYLLKPDLTVPDLATAAAAAKREAEGFVAATTFSGAKPGFIFKADVAGLGYYPDSSAK